MAVAEHESAERVRTHVSLRRDLVEQIDALVGPRQRSRFMAAAVERELRRLRLKAAVAEVAGSRTWGDVPGWETSESAAEWVRSMRREWDRPDEGEPGPDP